METTKDKNTWKSWHLPRLLAFDADDTLWDCQGHFDAVEREYCKILAEYGDEKTVSDELFRTETGNMPILGYGSKAFTISLVENAIRISQGKVSNESITKIINLGKTLLQLPATPLPGVRETLEKLKGSKLFEMVVFTKGDSLDQENKFKRSGLEPYFDDIVVVADKTKKEYERLCRLFDTDIKNMCMVGNSYKSDIKPVLDLGGYAIHIPYSLMWKYEETEEPPHPHMIRIKHFSDIATFSQWL